MKKIRNEIKKIKWELNNFLLRNEHKWRPLLKNSGIIFRVILYISIYFICLNYLKVIEVSFKPFKFIINSVEYTETIRELVIAQVGSTFLTTAIISLISSIDDKRIFGEKITNLLFGKKLLKFHLPVFALYISLIINVVLIIVGQNANLILALTLFSFLDLIYIVTNVGSIFLSTKKYKDILFVKYYKECEKNIINNTIPRNYNSRLLVNLKEETIKSIANSDVSYVKNINMYKVLIDRLLFNMPKDLQKYHLDMTYAPSIINDFIEIIEHFIYFNDTTRAIQYYYWLLSRFNYHNVYICYGKINSIPKMLFNKINDFKNEYELMSYLDYLSPVITEIEMQEHFALKNDFSYINKPYLTVYHYKCSYFGLIYENIKNNKYLSDKEKINALTNIYEIFRLSAHNGCNMVRDITSFSYTLKIPDKREMNPSIVGQATAFLLMKTLLYKDERSFRLFLGMNIEASEMRFAIHTVILSLINIENMKENENIYSDFYGLDLDFCKEMIEKNIEEMVKTELWMGNSIIEEVQKSYDFIYKTCSRKQDECDLSIYHLYKYDEELINQYFDTFCKKYKLKINIKNNKKKNYSKIIKFYI